LERSESGYRKIIPQNRFPAKAALKDSHPAICLDFNHASLCLSRKACGQDDSSKGPPHPGCFSSSSSGRITRYSPSQNPLASHRTIFFRPPVHQRENENQTSLMSARNRLSHRVVALPAEELNGTDRIKNYFANESPWSGFSPHQKRKLTCVCYKKIAAQLRHPPRFVKHRS
jgi:hypothetical protein